MACMARPLYSDAQVIITFDDDTGIVRYTRSREPYPSLEVIRALHVTINAEIAKLPQGQHSLLVDVRDAPPRNDNPFEAEITKAIGGAAPHFVRRAALVKSVVGSLQVKRIAKARGDDSFPTFSDEAEAIAFLRMK
jgi:hypothetical protein